jgi:hypothetical protein
VATIQVILAGRMGTSMHDTFDYPIVLQFGGHTNYGEAEWVIPSFGPHIPAGRLSEIRVQLGSVPVLIDGPEGFRSGPYEVSWIRSLYPRGKHCALLQTDSDLHKLVGVTLTTHDDTLFIDEFPEPVAP